MALSGLFKKKTNDKKELTEEELGQIEYEEGIKCLKADDIDTGFRHLKKAADLGNLTALAELAIIQSELFKANHDVTFRENAIHNAYLACLRSFKQINALPVVYYNIAVAHEEQNELEIAINFYKQSADLGGVEAAVKLALIYAENYETLDLANTWAQKASELGCDDSQLLEIAKRIYKAERRVPQVNLNEEFVDKTFELCKVKEDTGDIIESVLFQKEYGFPEDSRPLLFDMIKILEVRTQLEYTLGQLQDVHEDYTSITTESVKNRYDGVDWTDNQTPVMAYLHLLLAAGLVKPVEIETGELQMTSEIIPTLLTTDPNYENWIKQNEHKLLDKLFGSENFYEPTHDDMWIQGRKYLEDENYENAIFWFEKAAKLGHARSQADLAYMYFNGKGVQKDEAKAFSLCKLAAAQGSAYAEFQLGAMHYKGVGTQRNVQEGIKWMKKAAEQGYEKAIETLKEIS